MKTIFLLLALALPAIANEYSGYLAEDGAKVFLVCQNPKHADVRYELLFKTLEMQNKAVQGAMEIAAGLEKAEPVYTGDTIISGNLLNESALIVESITVAYPVKRSPDEK